MNERTRREDDRHEEAVAPEPTSAAPRVKVRSGTAPTSRSRLELGAVTALLAAGLVGYLAGQEPVTRGVGLAVALGALADLLVVGPAALLARRFALDAARLRAALACPFCKDALSDDSALACERAGCGAFYHPECWAECKASYGGCAIYGCGCTTSRPVGRFGLQRHVLRLLVATLLFTPRLVKRIQEHDRASFRDVWARARAYQREVSLDTGRTLLMGGLNLFLSLGTSLAIGVTGALIGEALRVRPDRWSGEAQGLFILATLVVLSIPPVLFMRLPLVFHFAWGVSKVVARLFRDELAALQRADEGTFLARLAGGLGKKG